MEYFRFCQPTFDYKAMKITANQHLVKQTIGITILDRLNNGSLKIQHIFKGERPETNLATTDIREYLLSNKFTRGYSGIRAAAYRSFGGESSPGKVPISSKSKVSLGINAGLHYLTDINETFLDIKYTSKWHK